VEHLTPSDIDRMARGALSGSGVNPGDIRIAKKLLEFRGEYGFPRSTIAQATGVSITSITRIELGQRGLSTHSLSHLVTGLRGLVRMMFPNRIRSFEKWAFEFLEIVATVEEEQRIARKRAAQERQQ
jgi:transcriptional regulator with XRE-family HTH domain